MSPYSRLSHGRSLSRFFVSIVQVPVRLNAQLGGISIVAVVLGLDVVARVGRFGLGNASSEELVSGRLRSVFREMDSSAARGALLACFLGGIVTVLCCISTLCCIWCMLEVGDAMTRQREIIFDFTCCPANGMTLKVDLNYPPYVSVPTLQTM